MRRAIFVYENDDLQCSSDQLQAFVSANRYVGSWSFVFPGMFFVKFDGSLGDLRKSFQDFLGNTSFVVASFDPTKADGLLPKGIWGWLTETPDAPKLEN